MNKPQKNSIWKQNTTKAWIVVKICDTTDTTVTYTNIYSKYGDLETKPTQQFLQTHTPHPLFD